MDPGHLASHASSMSSQEQWQRQCSDTMRHLAQRIMDPQLPAREASGHRQREGAQEVCGNWGWRVCVEESAEEL